MTASRARNTVFKLPIYEGMCEDSQVLPVMKPVVSKGIKLKLILATEKMAKLHDALKANGYEGHHLEVYLV